MTNSASESAVSEAKNGQKQDAARLRADAVSLEVPVKVHGSRVKDVVLGTTPHTEPFEEQTTTMIVFPQGGVLKMSTPVSTGQMMVVTNLKSGHDAICRVIKARGYGQGQSYVEIEFTHRQSGYWGVYFPSEGTDKPSAAAPTPPVAAPAPVEAKVDKPEEKPAPLRTPPTRLGSQPPKKPSAFAPIGSQEDVQVAASSTSTRTWSGRDTDSKGIAAEAARKSLLADFPSAPPPAPALSITQLQGDTPTAPAISFASGGVPGEAAETATLDLPQPSEDSATPFGRFAASASLGGSHAAREPFGALTGGALGTSGHVSGSSQSKSGNWLMIAASVAALLVVGTAAAYFLHMPPFDAKSAKPTTAATAPVAPTVDTTPQSTTISEPASPAPELSSQPAASVPVARPAAAPVTARVSEPAAASKPARTAPQTAAIVASAPAAQKSAAKVPDMFGAINAHPTSRAHAGNSGQDAAPSFDASAGNETGGLATIETSPAVAPPAPEAAQAPVRIRVGGEVKPPRLISSVLPVYPAIARESGVEGDVVIDTTLDATGKVTSMKVISGPTMLRQAALDALRHWKYEPSMLNGQPMAVQMTVTIKFHR